MGEEKRERECVRMLACMRACVCVCVRERKSTEIVFAGVSTIEIGGKKERERECVCVHVCVRACVCVCSVSFSEWVYCVGITCLWYVILIFFIS